jgi:hypothetical protein
MIMTMFIIKILIITRTIEKSTITGEFMKLIARVRDLYRQKY